MYLRSTATRLAGSKLRLSLSANMTTLSGGSGPFTLSQMTWCLKRQFDFVCGLSGHSSTLTMM